MNTQEAASLATKEANPVIDGRKANVNLAYLGAKPRVIPSPAGKFSIDIIYENFSSAHYLWMSFETIVKTKKNFRLIDQMLTIDLVVFFSYLFYPH